MNRNLLTKNSSTKSNKLGEITIPYVDIKVTGGAEAPTAQQKAELIERVTPLLQKVLHKKPETTVVIIDEVDMDNWGSRGKTVTTRRAVK